MGKLKYTREMFAKAVRTNTSYTGVARALGIKYPFNAVTWIKQRIDKEKLSSCFSHKKYIKYNKETLEPIVKKCTSVRQVVKTIGLVEAGGNENSMAKRLRRLGISTSHFTGQAHNKGKISEKRLAPEQLLKKRLKGPRVQGFRLTRALIALGVKHKCAWCGQGCEWNNKPLTLAVDHINGDAFDNRRENLRFLCPNCHTQTDTYCSKKYKARRIKYGPY